MTIPDGMPRPPRPPFDPVQYLGAVLPAQLRLGKEPPPGGRAIIQFLVTHLPGGDYWYRVSGAEQLEVHTGVNDRPDLTVILRAAELQALSQDTLDIPRALDRGHLRVHGDTALLRWLAGRLRS